MANLINRHLFYLFKNKIPETVLYVDITKKKITYIRNILLKLFIQEEDLELYKKGENIKWIFEIKREHEKEFRVEKYLRISFSYESKSWKELMQILKELDDRITKEFYEKWNKITSETAKALFIKNKNKRELWVKEIIGFYRPTNNLTLIKTKNKYLKKT